VEHVVDVAPVGHHQNVRSYLRRTHLLYDVSSDVEQASSGDVMNSYELSETEQMWTSSGPQHEARRLPLLQRLDRSRRMLVLSGPLEHQIGLHLQPQQ
jgi:hypothetical protein